MNMYENIKSSIKESDNNVVEKMCSFIGDLFKNEAEGFTANSESLYDWCEGGDAFYNAGYDENTCNKLNKLLMEINPIVQELNGKLFEFYGTLNESTDGELEKLKNELRYRAIDLYGDGDISSEVTNEDIDKIANKIKASGFFISNDIFTDDNDEYEWQKINDFLDDEIRKYKSNMNEAENSSYDTIIGKSVEIEDTDGNTLMGFQVDNKGKIINYHNCSIADESDDDYLFNSENSLVRIQKD